MQQRSWQPLASLRDVRWIEAERKPEGVWVVKFRKDSGGYLEASDGKTIAEVFVWEDEMRDFVRRIGDHLDTSFLPLRRESERFLNFLEMHRGVRGYGAAIIRLLVTIH